jgi:membrane-associated phospholipid phosphatase
VVQRLVLRPLLLDSGTRREDQSFPSGHAAVAMATMCAVVLVVPPRWRVPAVLVTSAWAVTITVATVVANWHRPSDTIGSGLIVLGYLAAAVALLARFGAARAIEPAIGVRRLRLGYTVAAGVSVVVAAVAVVAGDVLFAGRAIAVASSLGVAWGLVVLTQGINCERRCSDG